MRPCVHFIGFRDDRYWNAVRIWGKPDYVHRWLDLRANRDFAPGDTVVFADGEWSQAPRRFNAPDIIESV